MLVTNRIWTEPQHIEARLADLTEHMENVIQKYLRNDFDTIAEYNEFAGEVAEPFRILVVANFPVNFTETAARRLTSIAASGARCGVYVLMTVDTQQPLPHAFDMQRHSAARDQPGVGRRQVRLERTRVREVSRWPSISRRREERFTQIVHLVGEHAKDSRRVEVPFEYIAPPARQVVDAAARPSGIDVPLGRRGATQAAAPAARARHFAARV